MLSAKGILFVLLGIFAAVFCAAWVVELVQRKKKNAPTVVHGVIGYVTNFIDTLGVSSFATTTSIYRLFRIVPDEKIPGTLNIGDTLPTVAQAFIFIALVQVDPRTLVLLICATVAGGWLGAGVVSRLPRRRIQLYMGVALLAAAGLILAKLLNFLPQGGDALHLDGVYLAIGMLANFVFGALMTVGVGAYAPIMITVALLGMNPTAAFPIMMGSCAFQMPIVGLRFLRGGRYDSAAALGLALLGVPAVLMAAFLVKELPLDVLRWLVVAVVIYTGTSLLWSARLVPPESNVNPT